MKHMAASVKFSKHELGCFILGRQYIKVLT